MPGMTSLCSATGSVAPWMVDDGKRSTDRSHDLDGRAQRLRHASVTRVNVAVEGTFQSSTMNAMYGPGGVIVAPGMCAVNVTPVDEALTLEVSIRTYRW